MTNKCRTLWGEPEQPDTEMLSLMSGIINSLVPGPSQLSVDGNLSRAGNEVML